MEETKTQSPTQPKNCGLATASLVLGIISLVLCVLFIPGLLAVIFGIVGLVKISNSNGLLTGKGKALAGIIMGGLSFILIPFAAIAAAIIIPNLLTSRISANETSAMAGLKLLVNAEAMWRAQDADNNNIKDFWTYDVSAFHWMLRPDKVTKLQYISADLARADAEPVRSDVFGDLILVSGYRPMPKSGYYFRAMLRDEKLESYNQELINGFPAANKNEFAFVAYPDAYGTSGVRTFIVNQCGTIYAADCGSDANKIILTWPGTDPSCQISPGGSFWTVAD